MAGGLRLLSNISCHRIPYARPDKPCPGFLFAKDVGNRDGLFTFFYYYGILMLSFIKEQTDEKRTL